MISQYTVACCFCLYCYSDDLVLCSPGSMSHLRPCSSAVTLLIYFLINYAIFHAERFHKGFQKLVSCTGMATFENCYYRTLVYDAQHRGDQIQHDAREFTQKRQSYDLAYSISFNLNLFEHLSFEELLR